MRPCIHFSASSFFGLRAASNNAFRQPSHSLEHHKSLHFWFEHLTAGPKQEQMDGVF